jgi:hypothetical protein
MAENKTFPRGARPTPRHKLLAAHPHIRRATFPAQYAIVPTQLSMWGNSQYGDCVSAEEAYAKAVWSIMCGLAETFPEQEVIAWAEKNGFLNGADLTDVMTAMAKSGFVVGGTNYSDGPYTGVDYSNESILQSAISQGPVKIGIDADALSSGAGNGNGWFSTGGTPYQFTNEDHCTGLSGYGTAAFLFGALNMPVPSGVSPTATGYLLFTWSSIGFVDHAWIMSTCGEAWLRNPTTPGQTPPAPTPTPTPTPTPPVGLGVLQVLQLLSPGNYSIGEPSMQKACPGSIAGTIDWQAIITILLEILAQLFPITPTPVPTPTPPVP